MVDELSIWLEWIAIVFLVLFSGLFSGLNLGLMSLDTVGLEIVMASDNAKHVSAAKKIKPLRDHGNWLLCTLLLGNVAVNAALSILLASYTDGIVGFTLSTSLIVVFGEIIPQAICSRYALEVGAKTIWIVWPLMFLLAVIAWPISYILDKVLGEELGTIYSNKELSKLVDITAKYRPKTMDKSTASMLKGALQLNTKCVSDIFTAMDNVFYLNENETLSFEVLTKIFKLGHSRIPVFRRDISQNGTETRPFCIGLIYVKDLILIDPADNVPIFKVLETFNHHSTPIDVWKDDNLQTALQLFIDTCQHLAFVKERAIGSNEIHYVGIVTLEDVIEEILKRQVDDEFDNPTKKLLNMNFHRKLSFESNEKVKRAKSAPQMIRPIPVMFNKTLISSPHIITAPFMMSDSLQMNEENDDNVIKIENVDRDEEESKYQSTQNVDIRTFNLNDKPKTKNINSVLCGDNDYNPRSTAKIRSIPEIKSYLEHFVPKLTVSTTISAFFIKPLLITINVYFIIYQFYASIFADTLISSLNFDGTAFRKTGINIMIIIEFSGLCILFFGAICAYFKANYAMSIDFIRWLGSWSIFQLFYFAKPFSLIKYAHKALTTQSVHAKDRINHWKSLRDNLKFEIMRNNTQQNINSMKKCLEHLNHLIALSQPKDTSELPKKGMVHSLNSTINDDVNSSVGSTSSFYSFMNKDKSSIDLSLDMYPQNRYHGNFAIVDAMIQGGTWFIFVVLFMFILALGVLCLILKLSLFTFIVSLPLSEWGLLEHWAVFLLFVNQIWNIIDVDCIKISTIYRFLFIDSSIKHSKYVSHRTSILDSVIKTSLWQTNKYRGFLLALSLNDEIVQKIIVNKSYDLSVLELIKYKKLLSDQGSGVTETESHLTQEESTSNESNQFKVVKVLNEKAKWFEMTDKHQRQPYHPYVVIRNNMDRFHHNMDAMKRKILVVVNYVQATNYKEYKLATAGAEWLGSATYASYDDDASMGSNQSIVARSLTRRRVMKLKNQEKRQNNKLLTEMSQMSPISKPHFYFDGGIEMKENKLLNESILFEWILSKFSKTTKVIVAALAIIGIVFTAMSVLLYFEEHVIDHGDDDDDECTYLDEEYTKIISIFDSLFVSFCALSLILSAMHLMRISQTKTMSLTSEKIVNCISGFLWIVLTIICFVRCVMFFKLSPSCKLFIMESHTIFFISALFAIYFSIFQSFVLLTVLLKWMSITWLLYMIVMYIAHLFLLITFYILGWNFVIHLITQTFASMHKILYEPQIHFSKYCQTRFIFFSIMFFVLFVYLIAGLLEIYYFIKSKRVRKLSKPQKKKIKKRKKTSLLADSSENKYYDGSIKEPGAATKDDIPTTPLSKLDEVQYYLDKQKKNLVYIQSKNARKAVMTTFYFVAMVYTIVHDVMVQKHHYFNISTKCTDIDYKLNLDQKDMFVIVMLVDIVLFGELFRSHEIMLNPVYWLVKSVWNTTRSITWMTISLIFTFGTMTLFVLLFLRYDLGIL